MQIIKSIEIKNFRSIKSTGSSIELSDLNILVGQNDNGKSNILRALNLFFNNQTDIDQGFRFSEDYCYHANSGTGSRREIKISLTIEPPKARFKHANTVKWTKRWKLDGSIIEDRIYIHSNQSLTSSDNISKWLDKLKYRYVPAIKGRDYFNTLMGELHDVLNEAHGTLMATQGQGFISGIQKVTGSITKELFNQIGIPSTIQVPSDFKQLFSNLDFGAKIGQNTYHLKQRGDGIKVRHIPVILKYMAEQEKSISIPGYVKPDTIWGFEEPENNLELRYAFELAETIRNYASDIQILVTTHSPAFYALKTTANTETKKYYIKKDVHECTTTKLIDEQGESELHEQMGLLPLITPYLEEVNEAQKTIQKLEHEISKIPPNKKYCIITEDSKNANLKTLLSANGFAPSDMEIFSYDGKGQVKGAIILGKYLKARNSDIVVIIHRDRDYLSNEEILDLKRKINNAGLNFFYTTGTDVESHFISVEHVMNLYPMADLDIVKTAISEATDEAKADSIGRFIDHAFQRQRPVEGGYASEIENINAAYNASPSRYRYGKKVFGLLKSKLHKAGYKSVKLESESDALQVDILKKLAS
jgi:AAA15 family ATPase/GTPase